MRVALTAFFALMLASASAQAEPSTDENKPWSLDLGVGNVWIGSARPTGGLTIVGGARHSWGVDRRTTVDAGLTGEVFGFAGGSYWMGVLVAPGVGAMWETPVDHLSVGGTASLAYGRVPVCNDWICLRFWGLFPGGSGRVAYGGEAVSFVADLTVRYVGTLAWEGASVGLVGGGRVRW